MATIRILLLLLLLVIPVQAIDDPTPTPEGGDFLFLRQCAASVDSSVMTFIFPDGTSRVFDDVQLVASFLDISGERLDIAVVAWLVKHGAFAQGNEIYVGETLRVNVYASPVSIILYVTTNMDVQDAACGMWEVNPDSVTRFQKRYQELTTSGRS